MEFWHIWYSRDAYDAFYKFAQSEDNYYNMNAINKLRLVDVSLGWSRIESIGEFARMSADQRIVHLIDRLAQQHQEFNIGYPLKEAFLRSPRTCVKGIHNEIMLMIEFDAWARFAATPAGQETLQMPKPRLAPETPPHAREQAMVLPCNADAHSHRHIG